MGEFQFGYWAAPFKGQPIRYLLEISKHAYKDKKYTDPNEWFGKDKQSLGFDFPNLPYLIDGNVKLTESQNIVNYIIDVTKQQNLLGEGKTKFQIDNVRFFCDDLIGKLFVVSTKQGEDKKKEIESNIIPRIKNLEKDLNKKTHFFNNSLTIADIYAYAALNLFQQLSEEDYKPFTESFKTFNDTFTANPQIKEYISSERCPKLHH